MTAPDAASFQQRFGLVVTPANVLDVRAVILQEAQDLTDMLRKEQDNVVLPPLGRDPVSAEMSREFNAVTRELLAQADRHVASLKALGDELAATARAYGRTEQEIEKSFGAARATAVSQVPTLLKHAVGLGASTARPPTSIAEILAGGRQ